jgi:desulfoferrodoxin-like iron-binding protein
VENRDEASLDKFPQRLSTSTFGLFARKVILILSLHHLSQEVSRLVNVSKEGEVYLCEICGNVVIVKVVGGGELVCCGQPMTLQKG